jgi:rhamnogalacturonan endolyase
MGALKLQSLLLLASAGFGLSEPFLKPLSNSSWLIGNDLWNITIGPSYGKKLYYQNQDLIGNAVGHYSGYGGHGSIS